MLVEVFIVKTRELDTVWEETDVRTYVHSRVS